MAEKRRKLTPNIYENINIIDEENQTNSRNLKRNSTSKNIDPSDLKIIYNNNYDNKQENNNISEVFLDTSNLISPLIDIINNYRDDGTGTNLYTLNNFKVPAIRNHSAQYVLDEEKRQVLQYGIFNSYHKAIIGLLSIAYTRDGSHSYNYETGIWTFDEKIKELKDNQIMMMMGFDLLIGCNIAERLFYIFHGSIDENMNSTQSNHKYIESFYIYEHKANFLGESDITYKILYGKLYRNDILMEKQSELVIEWWKQFTKFLSS